MKNLIYQMWDGMMPQGELAGQREMQAYAERIGAEYRFDHNTCYFRSLPAAYGRFRILHDDAFVSYDKVAYADTDIWPVDGLTDDLFAASDTDLGICTEPLQPAFRAAATHGICKDADEAWAKRMRKVYGIKLPRNEEGLLKVYNSGLQVWSAAGRIRARAAFIPFKEYREAVADLKLHPLYSTDQHYLHAMMLFAGLHITEMDNDWNRYVHYQPHPAISDQRTPTTKMVHVQLRSAGNWDRETLHRVVNKPQAEWRLP